MYEESKKLTCLRCGGENEDSVEYCRKCERELENADNELESITTINRLVYGYLTFTGFLLAFVFFSLWIKYINDPFLLSELLSYEFVTYSFLIGLIFFIAAFAKPFVINFLGKFRETSVLNKLGSEFVHSYVMRIDYIKLVCSVVSCTFFTITLWMFYSRSEVTIFTFISLILLAISLTFTVRGLYKLIKVAN